MNTLPFQITQNSGMKANMGKNETDTTDSPLAEGQESFRDILSGQIKRENNSSGQKAEKSAIEPSRTAQKNLKVKTPAPEKPRNKDNQSAVEDVKAGGGKNDIQLNGTPESLLNRDGLSDPLQILAAQGADVQQEVWEANEKTGEAMPADATLVSQLSAVVPVPVEGKVNTDGIPQQQDSVAPAALPDKGLSGSAENPLQAAQHQPADVPDNTKFVDHMLELASRQKESAVEIVKPGPGVLNEQPSAQPLMAAGYQMATALAQMQPEIQAASSNTIAVYPGKAGWDQAIGNKVIWMVGAAEQSATLTLNPPELGPLKVVIHVQNDQANTTFISEHPEVRKAIENGIPALREMMGQSGISLGQANISSGSQQQDNRQAGSHGQPGTAATERAPGKLSGEHGQALSVRAGNGLVDTFA